MSINLEIIQTITLNWITIDQKILIRRINRYFIDSIFLNEEEILDEIYTIVRTIILMIRKMIEAKKKKKEKSNRNNTVIDCNAEAENNTQVAEEWSSLCTFELSHMRNISRKLKDAAHRR